MKRDAWLWYAALVVAVGQFYFVSSVSSEPDANIYTAIGASGLLAVVVAMFLRRQNTRLGWALLAISTSLYLTGDAVLAGLQDDSPIVAFPSAADWIYLAMYPVVIIGVMLIRRSIVPRRPASDMIDGVVVGSAAFAVIGALYMNDLFTNDLFGRQAQIVGSAYPVLDVALVAVAVWFALGVMRSAPGLTMISLGLILVAVGNAVFNVQNIGFAFESGGIADLCWLGFTSLIGAAALHPSSAVQHAEFSTAPTPAPARRSILIASLSAIGVGQVAWGTSDDLAYTFGAATVAIVAVSWSALANRSSASVSVSAPAAIARA